MFPFSPVEGDEQGVINGIREMVRPSGSDFRFRYDYAIQPGAYRLTMAVHSATGADPGRCYFALSATSAALFAILAAVLCTELAGSGFGMSLVMVLLCQEIQRAGFYANSSTMAGCLALGALLVLVRRPAGLLPASAAGVLFALAGWARLDSLVVAPATLVVLWRKEPAPTAVAKTALVALVTVVLLFLLFKTSGLGPVEVFGCYSGGVSSFPHAGHYATLRGAARLTMWITSLAGMAAAAVGLWQAVRWRRTWLICLLASVFIPTVCLYALILSSPKYFYYVTPFLALVTAAGLRTLWAPPDGATSGRRSMGRAIVVVLAGAMALEYTTGLRTPKSEFTRFTPEPTWARIASLGDADSGWSWVVGPGEIQPHNDGFSLRMGLGFAGLVWHREKLEALGQLQLMRDAIDGNSKVAILTTTYLSYQCAVGYLRQKGFDCRPLEFDPRDGHSHVDVWERGKDTVWLAWINLGEHDVAIFEDYSHRFSGCPVYFFNDLGPFHAKRLLRDPSEWKSLGPRTDGFLALYLRQK
jgi:hypothetical protein